MKGDDAIMIAFNKIRNLQQFSCNSKHFFPLLGSSSYKKATFRIFLADFEQDLFYNTAISLHIILISAMFWQGGGKKRLKHQIENIMEVPQQQVDRNAIGKNDDELLHIYYFRDGYSDAEEHEEVTPRPHKFRQTGDSSPIIERSNAFSGLTFPSSNSRLPKSHIE